MSDAASGSGVIDGNEGEDSSCRIADWPRPIPPSGVETHAERASREALSAVIQEIVDEIPHLRRYAGFLTRNATAKEDLVQDCLERALSRIGQFRPGTELRRWLFTILRNAYIDAQRKEARRCRQVPILDRDCLTLVSPQLFHVRLKEVEAAIRQLSPIEREIIFLSVFLGASHQAIADRMNLPVGTVKSRLSRARDKLREDE